MLRQSREPVRAERAELVARVALDLPRRMSLRMVLLHQAIAARLGLSGTDLKCLDLVCGAEGMTSGELAHATGLTTGAITGVVDRLERAGFVRRVPDATDRRRVRIELVPARMKSLERAFDSLRRSWMDLAENYDDRELAAIADFLTSACEVMREEVDRLQAAG